MPDQVKALRSFMHGRARIRRGDVIPVASGKQEGLYLTVNDKKIYMAAGLVAEYAGEDEAASASTASKATASKVAAK